MNSRYKCCLIVCPRSKSIKDTSVARLFDCETKFWRGSCEENGEKTRVCVSAKQKHVYGLVVFKNDNFQFNGDFQLKDFDRMRNLTLASYFISYAGSYIS